MANAYKNGHKLTNSNYYKAKVRVLSKLHLFTAEAEQISSLFTNVEAFLYLVSFKVEFSYLLPGF